VRAEDMKIRHGASIIIGVFFLLMAAFPAALPAEEPQERSCAGPPFVSPGSADTTKNNLLFILDSSGSMNWFAYQKYSGTLNFTVATELGTTTATWNGTCQNKPSCSSFTSKKKCKGSCTDTFYWSIQGTNGVTYSGNCDYTFSCAWIGGTCVRQSPSKTCEKTSGDDWSITESFPFDCDDSGNCTITAQAKQSDSYDADRGFEPGKKYYGIFDSTKLYKYSNTDDEHFFYTQDDWNGVGPGNLAACSTSGGCTHFDKFSGNFLNWVTTRRIDAAKKVLTGGRLGGDKKNWVAVGSPVPPAESWGLAKLFNDNGSGGYYFTPFHNKGLGIKFGAKFGSKYATATARIPLQAGDPDYGNLVPLMEFYEVTFNSSGSIGTTANPAVVLSKGAGGEPDDANRTTDGS